MAKKKVKFPENLPLKAEVKKSGRSIRWYAQQIGVDRQTVSQTINGHYKGTNIVPKLNLLLTQ
ncbi:hypothetical protein [Mucilaginibacter glaciei]|uniref:Uncharacterized protein n=1 Tax=Mucilaginibacter glaciei TaxID=2772109 RepID=A0A926NNA0_9SPHI|nr:hypothetical protein [Mucilaginibacter glaciei]MBD1394296.1 hypothetical protein [Mucilaginibacter glaciei]